MPPLHPPAAAGTVAVMNVELPDEGLSRQVGLPLRAEAFIDEFVRSTSRATRRQRHVVRFVDVIGNGPPLMIAVIVPRLATRFLRGRLRRSLRERRRLPLARAALLLQQPGQLLDPCFQSLDLCGKLFVLRSELFVLRGQLFDQPQQLVIRRLTTFHGPNSLTTPTPNDKTNPSKNGKLVHELAIAAANVVPGRRRWML